MKLAQLHLRDLFWFVLVCALGMAWWRQENQRLNLKMQLTREKLEFIDANKEALLIEMARTNPRMYAKLKAFEAEARAQAIDSTK